MKKIFLSTCIAAFGALAMLSLPSCSDALQPYPWVVEGDESDEEGAGAKDMSKLEQELRGAIPFMLNYSHEPTGTWAPHKYQYYRSNTIDNYCGYWTTTKANFQFGPALPYLYYEPNGYMGGPMDTQLFQQSRNAIKYASDMTQEDGTRIQRPEWRAIALIIQAYLGHEIVDFYGVAAFKDWRNNVRTTLTYQSGEEVYKQILADLDEAIAILKQRKPSQADLQRVEGTLTDKTISDWQWQRWVKFANSIKLRMAMNIVDFQASDPTYGNGKPFVAQNIAEEAVNDEIGVLMPGDRDIAYVTLEDSHDCCLYSIGNGWNDIRLNANLENIMKRLDNPLLAVWFPKNSYAIKDKNGRTAPSGIYGVRAGIMMEDNQGADRGGYGPFAALAPSQKNMDQFFFKVAEVTFLRCEGALRNWNMGGDAKSLYELGIRESFKEWGLSEAQANTYLQRTEVKPVNYIDYYDRRNDIAGRVNIGVKWNEADSKELKLEKIITQKWIANFPMGAEAWTTYRRTGYPRLFPVPINSTPGVDTEMQIRRLKFNETDNNSQELSQIIQLMGGSQTCGDRVFWDVNSATWAMDENGQYIPDNHLN